MTGGLASRSVGVDVVIPVFDNAQALERCLSSVRRWSEAGQRIVILDDDSREEATHDVLARWSEDPNVLVLRSDRNLGYTANVNRWLRKTRRDVLLLNSDTEVGPLWSHTLRRAAYSGSRIAAVSAVSNNAGAMSVPDRGIANDWRATARWEDAARTMVQHFGARVHDVPTIHGFCVYLRSDALAAVGLFDEVTFTRGYGEENDWSRRAVAAGWQLGMVPGVIVHHDQGGSFGDERASLIELARELLNLKHPDYSASIRRWFSGEAYQARMAEIREVRANTARRTPRRRILYVLHHSGGGTPETNLDLMARLEAVQESFVLLVRPQTVELYRFAGGRLLSRLQSWAPSAPFRIDEPWVDDYAEFIGDLLERFSIEIVHVRHLINQPLLTIPRVVKSQGLRFVLSTHDFYYICPSVNLLDDRLDFCGGVCTPGEGRCYLPNDFVNAAPELKHGWVATWQAWGRELVQLADRIVVTTPSARSIYERIFPEIDSKVVVIEHGRDSNGTVISARDAERTPGPLRIVCPANWAPHKGAEFISALIAETSQLIEWHIIGNRSELVLGHAVRHPGYRRDQFGDILRAIDPDFVGLFSVWPETYSHTLSEAWTAGVPVLATNLGAVADRISEFGGGRVFDHRVPETLVDFLKNQARAVLGGASPDRPSPREFAVRAASSMAEDYDAIYSSVVVRERGPSVGYLPSSGRGASHVRVKGPAASVAMHGLAEMRLLDIDEVLSGRAQGRFRAVLVQRDAVPRERTEEFADAVRDAGSRLVLDLDDDLLTESSAVDDRVRDAVRALAHRADQLTVSTERLVRVAADVNAAVRLVENAIDEPPWQFSVGKDRPPRRRAPVRMVYWGTRSHQTELDWLKSAFDRLRDQRGRRVELDVVGVASRDEGWYTRLIVPEAEQEYTAFARWMAQMSRRRNWVAGLAPLVASDFTEAKSDIKILEGLALGLPVVAAAVGPYAAWTDRSSDVRVIPMDTAAWREALQRHPVNRVANDIVVAERSVWTRHYADQWLRAIAG